MRSIILLSLVFTLLACNSNNGKSTICDCVEAGQAVNQLSESFFSREATQEGADSLHLLIEKRDSVCKTFQEMDAIELQEKAKECASLEIETEEK
ncbi:MAG: hypothetical protein H3C31_09815 [Brumimicrobium sp.]|nr:hypothetical protein [Brumimicrobium sp.]MCO5269953.1 hypothetical protein [Brumimicrobium sp.]